MKDSVIKFTLTSAFGILVSCSSTETQELSDVEQRLQGTISYPFAKTNPIGVDAKAENFVIKTSVGGTEYVVEIPHGGQDYDIVVPLAKMGGEGRERLAYKEADAIATDKEMVSNLPTLENKKSTMTSMLDKAYGVGKSEGATQSPSYTLKLVKIKDHYKNKNFELALIEVNSLLSYYPTSSQLYKMKGSIFLKMRQLDLAEKSWVKAAELDPSDKILRTGIARLQDRIQRFTTPDQRVPSEIDRPATDNLPSNMLSH